MRKRIKKRRGDLLGSWTAVSPVTTPGPTTAKEVVNRENESRNFNKCMVILGCQVGSSGLGVGRRKHTGKEQRRNTTF